MGKYDEKRIIAQSLYTKSKLNRNEIAKTVGISEKTLRSWIVKFEWDILKEANTVSRQQLLADAYAQLKKVNQVIEDKGGVPDKALADVKSTLRKEILQFSDTPLPEIVEVITEITEFAVSNYPDNVADLSRLFLDFIDNKMKK